MLSTIYGVVIWIIVPIIIGSLLVFSMFLISQVTDSILKISARAGFWAGLLFFVIHVMSELQNIHNPDFKSPSLPKFDWLPLIGGIAIGFFFLWAVRLLLPTRVVGILTLILTFAGSAALFDYLFLANIRDLATYVVLGLVVGILGHLILFPDFFRSILNPHDFPKLW